MTSHGGAPHSADQFTAARDYWWHDDFLALVARRLGLGACRNVLELGAGVGHWTARLIAMCAPDARLTAVDREHERADRLRRRFSGTGRVEVVCADVTALPALPGGYDLVSCQTLLLHIADVPALLRRMLHLLAPGGLILLAEPNNHLNRLPGTSAATALAPREYGQLAEMWWAFEIGRQRLGLGAERIAEMLPGMIAAAGFEGLEVRVNDRAFPGFPPYAPPEGDQYPLAEDAAAVAADETLSRRLALAGGLDPAAFEAAWAIERKHAASVIATRHAGTLSCAGNAGSLFLFSARKPRA